MQATAFRSLSGMRCRPAAAVAQPKQRYVQPRLVRVQASADMDSTNRGNQALEEYQALERSGSADFAAFDRIRQKYGIRRTADGRAQLRSKDGVWYQLKLDNELQGTMLLRNTSDGTVHVLQTDKLEQIDLSDDYLLLLMFSDSNWSETIQPIQIGDGQDNIETLVIDEQQFKDTVGMIKTLQEMEEQDQDAAGPGYTVADDGREIELDPRSVRPVN